MTSKDLLRILIFWLSHVACHEENDCISSNSLMLYVFMSAQAADLQASAQATGLPPGMTP